MITPGPRQSAHWYLDAIHPRHSHWSLPKVAHWYQCCLCQASAHGNPKPGPRIPTSCPMPNVDPYLLDPTLPYTMVMDTLADIARRVLMQDQGDGLRLVAFMSQVLKPTKQRYSGYERELAAVAYCCILWRHYLEDCPGWVMVVIDYYSLTHLIE